jgi:hypothetical protein
MGCVPAALVEREAPGSSWRYRSGESNAMTRTRSAFVSLMSGSTPKRGSGQALRIETIDSCACSTRFAALSWSSGNDS